MFNIEYLKYYEEGKFWLAIGGALWYAFKGLEWIKQVRENDLKHIHSEVQSLGIGVKEQTLAFVKAVESNTVELKELRRDLFTALVSPIPAKARAKRK